MGLSENVRGRAARGAESTVSFYRVLSRGYRRGIYGLADGDDTQLAWKDLSINAGAWLCRLAELPT